MLTLLAFLVYLIQHPLLPAKQLDHTDDGHRLRYQLHTAVSALEALLLRLLDLLGDPRWERQHEDDGGQRHESAEDLSA